MEYEQDCPEAYFSVGGQAPSQGDEPDQVYTDNSFHHLSIPPNYDASSFDPDQPDLGLAHFTGQDGAPAPLHEGHFRTPTLRNVAKRRGAGFPRAYMHNGYLKRLEDVVHFYNTASVKLDPIACPPGTTAAEARARDCWPAGVTPHHQGSVVGTPFVGNLGLTEAEEAALVAYLKTLTDTVKVKAPRP